MFGMHWTEILVIVLIILLLFGAKRIPDVMRSLGKGVRELKKGMQGLDTEDEKKEPGPPEPGKDKTEPKG